MPDPTVAVVFLSCDRPTYEASLHACLQLLAHHWPDCPWPVRAHSGGGHWGVGVARAADQFPADLWLVMMDDYALTETPDTAALVEHARLTHSYAVPYCRVVPTPGPSEPVQELWPNAGRHHVGDPYRFSLQGALIEPRYFAERAQLYADPWSFETQESGDPLRVHLSVVRSHRPLSYRELLKRGQWMPEGREVCEAAGVEWPG